MIEIFVVVGILCRAGIAVGEQNGFEPTVGAQARFKGVIGRIGDEGSVIWAHGEKGRKAVDQCRAEAFVDAVLKGQVAVEIFGGVEGVVGFGDVIGENRGVEFCFVPVAGLHGFGEFWL